MKATLDLQNLQNQVIATLESTLGRLLPREEMMVREFVDKNHDLMTSSLVNICYINIDVERSRAAK